MGRKDAMSTGLPVDQYRKQIGKQDKKVKKQYSKEMKRQSEARKSAMGIQEVILVMIVILALLVGLYFLLFVNLSKKDIPSSEPYAQDAV